MCWESQNLNNVDHIKYSHSLRRIIKPNDKLAGKRVDKEECRQLETSIEERSK